MIPIILLAAGSSSRMGQSKQLLNIGGEPLLLRSVARAIEANIGHVVVVLGANENSHKKIIQDYPVQIVSNTHWESGMGSSIKVGLKYIEENYPKSEGIVISVCDQPHLTGTHYKELVKKFKNENKNIVASAYSGTLGVPILFGRFLFNELKKIGDTEGAKKIVNTNRDQVARAPFALGAIDLDTMEDYNTFNQ